MILAWASPFKGGSIENPPPLPGDNPEIHNNIVGGRLERFSEKIFWLSIRPKKLTSSYHAI